MDAPSWVAARRDDVGSAEATLAARAAHANPEGVMATHERDARTPSGIIRESCDVSRGFSHATLEWHSFRSLFVVSPRSVPEHSAARGGRAFAPAMASRRDALRSLLRGARSVSLARTHHPAAASYGTATTSGWRAWKGYGEERTARGGTRALDRAAREERALNDLLVQSGHHERVLALVENGVVSHDAAFGVTDRSPASSRHHASRRTAEKTEPRDASSFAFRAANVATAFSRLRSALRRVPLGGVANRRREVASRVVCHDARYAKMREMLRDALPRFGPTELAATIKALADIHAFAGHGRAPALRASHHDTPEKHDTELGVLFARCMKTHARECDTRRTVLLVAGVRGLGRVAHRIADDDGWRAVADAVAAASARRETDATSGRSRKDARNTFAWIAWNLHYGDSWRSANRLKRNPEPLSGARERLGGNVWRAVAEKIVFGETSTSPPTKTRVDAAAEDAEDDDDDETEKLVYSAPNALPLSRRGLAMAMDAFCGSSALRAALDALDADTGGAARRELQAATDGVAAATFGADGFDWRSDARVSETRRRLLIGWGPTPARVAAGRAPTECLAIGRGCRVLGLRAHEGFEEPAPPRAPAPKANVRANSPGKRRRRGFSKRTEDVFFARDEDEDGGVFEDDDDDRTPGGGLLDVERFRVAGGRLDLAAIPPAPPKPREP